jgi:leader peptidase (prepilin peptidase)/N-methyltransferase
MLLFLPVLLLLLAFALALYDFRTRRVPNWVTLPLLLTGMFVHAPGSLDTWLGTALLFAFWRFETLGGGDVKLWMALLWLVPIEWMQAALIVIGFALVGTALAQLLWRYVCGLPMFGVQSPGAWRVIPFVVWMLWMGISDF